MLILSGILVMVIGLMLRFNALLVVVAAGFVTGLAGGLSINAVSYTHLRPSQGTWFVL